MNAFCHTLLSASLIAGILLNSLLSSVILVSYEINKLEIIQKYCVNKDQPQLQCDGKCHLSEQLSMADGPSDSEDQKGPAPEENEIVHWIMTDIDVIQFIERGHDLPFNFRFPGELTGFHSPPDQPPKKVLPLV